MKPMAGKDGREAREPYRIRVGNVWYWVDPRVPASDIEPSDMVVIYPMAGEATLAVLQSPFKPGDAGSVAFSSLGGERFTVPANDIAALHLAAVDDEQT